MNRNLAIFALGLFLLGLGMAHATTGVGATGDKLGYIDIEKTLFETDAGKAAQRKFEKQREKRQKQVDKEQDKLNGDLAQLEKDKATLAPDAYQKRAQELQQKVMKLRQTFAELEQELAKERAKLIEEVLEKAGPVIEDIASREGYTIIVDRSAVLWADDGLDITAQVNSRVK